MVIGSCTKEKESTLEKSFPGKWIDNKMNVNEYHSVVYSINFQNDSFYMHKFECSDLIPAICTLNLTDVCWDNYSKGKFEYSGDSIFFSGIYCDSNYVALEETDCSFRIPIGTHVEKWKYEFTDHTLDFYKKDAYPFKISMVRDND